MPDPAVERAIARVRRDMATLESYLVEARAGITKAEQHIGDLARSHRLCAVIGNVGDRIDEILRALRDEVAARLGPLTPDG